MVFFNCNACGEALKKNQVEKHTFKCRQCNVLSCVDCGKDFWGEEYQQHTKCMTENEKYNGPGYVAKANKGEVKQEAWIEKVQKAIEQSSSNGQLKGLLMKMQDYPNIPRKKAKFENFLKNSLRCLSPHLISQCWDLLMASANTAPATDQKETTETKPNETTEEKTISKEEPNPEEENETKKSLNKRERKEERQKKNKKEKKEKPQSQDDEDETQSKKKKKKRKHAESDEEEEDNDNEETSSKKRKLVGDENCDGNKQKSKKKKNQAQEEQDDELANGGAGNHDKFDWGVTIKAVLEKKGEMSYKKLRRKVLQEFAALESANYKDDNLHIKFDKKIRKMKHVSIENGRAVLSS